MVIDLMEYSTDALAQAAYVSSQTSVDVVDQIQESDPTSKPIYGVGGANEKVAQSFKVSAGGITCSRVDLKLYKVGSPTDNLEVRIETDSAGNPSGTLVNANATKSIAMSSLTISDIGAWYTFTFPGTFILAENTTYWIVMQRSGARDTVNFCEVKIATGNLYANGNFAILNNSSWTQDTNNDAVFYVYRVDTVLQCYSEATIKQQGSDSLKVYAKITDSLNDTLTRTVSPPIDLSNVNIIKFWIYASRTGSNIKIGIRDSGLIITEITPNIITANTWQEVTLDISAVANVNKDAIDRIIVTIVEASAANIFYLDNMRAIYGVTVQLSALTLASALLASITRIGKTIYPSALTLATALQTSIIRAGVTAKPSVLTLALALQTPTVKWGSTAKPSALTLALAIQTPTIIAYKFAAWYRVELRDRNGNLKQYLTPWVTSLSWEWNRIGGCGRCRIKLAMQYRKIKFTVGDDIQIRLESGTQTKLVYRGWIAYITPSLKIGEDISLDVRGYFDKLKNLVVQSAGGAVTYTAQQISAIVNNIIDTFVVPKSNITKGTIDVSSFQADTLTFKADVAEVLETLADLLGNVEYGVNENRVFFWRNESTALRRKFFVGYDVERYERREDGDSLLNKIYFEGGKVAGVTFTRIAEITESQGKYYLAEGIIINSAITTTSVADQYLTAILKKYAEPKVIIRIKIPNTALRLEDSLPLGTIAVQDPDFIESIYIWGKTASGGSNLIWGITAPGSNKQWGGLFKDQINRIDYQISDTEEKANVEITTGGGILATSAQLKRLDLMLSGLRQKG